MKLAYTIASISVSLMLFTGTISHAASINFTEAPEGQNNATNVILSNATINNAGSGSLAFFHGDDAVFPGNNELGAICGYVDTSCRSHIEILFKTDVKNLSVGFSAYDVDDKVEVKGFLDGQLVESHIITSETSLSLGSGNSLTAFDKLLFLNLSTSKARGLVYRDIEFDYVNADELIATPLPAALPMFGAALMGLMGLRFRRKNK